MSTGVNGDGDASLGMEKDGVGGRGMGDSVGGSIGDREGARVIVSLISASPPSSSLRLESVETVVSGVVLGFTNVDGVGAAEDTAARSAATASSD